MGAEEAEGDTFPEKKFQWDFCFLRGDDVTINKTSKQLTGLVDIQFDKNLQDAKVLHNPATKIWIPGVAS